MTRSRSIAGVVAMVVVALTLAPSAHGAVAFGIGDQSASMFTAPAWKALRLTKARYFVHWNAITNPAELREADAYIAAARAARVKVLLHISTDDLRPKRGTLPSVAQYRTQVGALIRRYRPQGVRDWGTWNEANHKTQPTYANPKRAAQFFVEMKRMCVGCTIVALDILDQAGFARYIQRWSVAAGAAGRTAKVFGIHNYSEVNRRRSSATRAIIATVRRFNRSARFWYTETGGLARFEGPGLDTLSEARQADRTQYMFDLTRRFSGDITRLYSYNLFGTADPTTARFDAGILNAEGTPRQAYATVQRNLTAPIIR